MTSEQLDDYLSQAKQIRDRELNAGISEGDDHIDWFNSDPLLPGFLLHNRLNMLVAEQGAGKSTFCLSLFRSLVERTASFLDLPLSRDKNYELYLVGPDMAADGWGPALTINRLLTSVTPTTDGTGFSGKRIKPFRYFSDSSSADSLSPQDIERYRAMALKSIREGSHPIFVFDSYRSLVAAYKPLDEIKAQFADPLQNLHRRMTGIGATIIVLHHTSKASTNAEKAGAGTNRLGAIPDVVVKMERLDNSPLSSDRRLVLQSAKRIDSTNLLIEQDFKTGDWTSYGEATKWIADRDLTMEQARLSGPKATIYEHFEVLWDQQRKGMTTDDVARLIEKSIQAARAHVKWLKAKGFIFIGDKAPTAGKPQPVYFPYYSKEDEILKEGFLMTKETPTGNPIGNPQNTSTTVANTGFVEKEPCETERTREPAAACTTHKEPETNVDGAPVPRKGLMVDVMKGEERVNHHVIACDGLDPHNLTVAKLGQPDLLLRGKRWLIDVFPCWNENEEL